MWYRQQDFVDKSSRIYEAKILNKKRFHEFIMFDDKKSLIEQTGMRRSI